jgi:hypothetical protein
MPAQDTNFLQQFFPFVDWANDDEKANEASDD